MVLAEVLVKVKDVEPLAPLRMEALLARGSGIDQERVMDSPVDWGCAHETIVVPPQSGVPPWELAQIPENSAA